jgi:ResB-like family.
LGLQLFGPPTAHFWRPPLHLLVSGLILAVFLIGLAAPSSRLVRRFSSPALAVALIASLLFLSLLMGLTPQSLGARPSLGWPDRLGLTRLAWSWPFILTYLATLVCLGLTLARRCRSFRPKPTFILNHLGLWLLLLSAGLGAAERRSYILWVEEGQVEWRGRTEIGLILDLPLAIELHRFELEHYPPELALIQRSAEPLATGLKGLTRIDPGRPGLLGTIDGWELQLENYLPRAEHGADGTWAASARSENSVPAALIAARRGPQHYRGWVSCGGSGQPLQTLELGPEQILTMARPEPRRYNSDLSVFTRDGRKRRGLVAVNEPLRLGPWQIYQHSYELSWSQGTVRSGLEAVYDPWWPLVRFSLALAALGGLMLIWRGPR